MSVQGAEAEAQEAGSKDVEERRQGRGQRVHFEALVEIGEDKGGGGFEAESVDVSTGGMRLRTAYLPEVGDKLVCRFDAPGSELVVDGEVLWRNEESRGGEFGLRFVDLDEKVTAQLRAMCVPEPEDAAAPASPDGAVRGARVRLHIEGLGSPMKARVRDTATEEIEVGSNLEFLRVGRALELEDVEGGSKREAYVDHVSVEIDPATSVPQLVVSLRYDGKKSESVRAPSKSTAPRAPSPTRASAATVEAKDRDDHAASETSSDEPSEAPSEARPGAALVAAGKLKGSAARAAGATAAAAKKLGPALAGMSKSGKRAFDAIVARVQKKRADRAEDAKGQGPRRTTAPPPAGALKADGRRLVREEDDAADDAPATHAPKSPKRAALVGSAIGLVMVLSLFGISRAMGFGHKAADAGATAGVDATVASAALPAATAPAALPPAASGVISANVPLFGATPLSTTETVPVPAPSGSAMPGAPDGELAAAAPGGAEDEPSVDDDGAPAKKEWGTGDVSHPIVLRIKMDGPVEGVRGASGPMGFTVTVPGRRALSTSSELARKDKRLESVDVVNTPDGAEVTVQFKDGVPPYLAKAKGERLEIALGTEKSDRKVASRTKKKHDKAHATKASKSPKATKKHGKKK